MKKISKIILITLILLLAITIIVFSLKKEEDNTNLTTVKLAEPTLT